MRAGAAPSVRRQARLQEEGRHRDGGQCVDHLGRQPRHFRDTSETLPGGQCVDHLGRQPDPLLSLCSVLSLPSVLSPLSPLLSPLSPSLSPSFSGRSHRHRRSHRPRRPPPQAPLPSCSCPALRRQAGLAPLSATSRSDLGSLSQAEAAGAPILATIRSSADAEQEPCWFTTAPAAAIPKALARAGLAVLDAGCAPLYSDQHSREGKCSATFRRHPAAFSGIQRHSAALSCARLHSAVFETRTSPHTAGGRISRPDSGVRS